MATVSNSGDSTTPGSTTSVDTSELWGLSGTSRLVSLSMSSDTTNTTSDTGKPDRFRQIIARCRRPEPRQIIARCRRPEPRVTLGTTGSRPSATVQYPDPEKNPVLRNVVAAATLAGPVATSRTEMDTQQAPAEYCTEPRKPRLRFWLATTRPARLTGLDESEPALGEQTRDAMETLARRKRRRHQATARAAFQAGGFTSRQTEPDIRVPTTFGHRPVSAQAPLVNFFNLAMKDHAESHGRHNHLTPGSGGPAGPHAR